MPAGKLSGLVKWLTETQLPLFLLDPKRRIRFFNRGIQQLTNLTTADVMGRICEFTIPQSDSSKLPKQQHIDNWLTQLAPSDNSAELTSKKISITLDDTQPRWVVFIRLTDAEKSAHYTLGLILNESLEEVAPFDAAIHQRNLLHEELQNIVRRKIAKTTLPFIAESSSMKSVLKQIEIACQHSYPVLISGKPGTGKTITCHQIVDLPTRSDLDPDGEPIVITLESKTLTKTALRNLLHNLPKQSQEINRPGRTKKPVLILEDIEALNDACQSELIETYNYNLDSPPFSIICTSSIPLSEIVANNSLREELIEILSTQFFELPELYKRKEDILLLSQFFLEVCNRHAENPKTSFSAEVLKMFRLYRWPGNVAELKKVVEESHTIAQGSQIKVDDLPFRFRTGWQAQEIGQPIVASPVNLDEILQNIEREWIEWALKTTERNRAAAAELLSITRPRLYRKMAALGMDEQASNTIRPDNTQADNPHTDT